MTRRGLIAMAAAGWGAAALGAAATGALALRLRDEHAAKRLVETLAVHPAGVPGFPPIDWSDDGGRRILVVGDIRVARWRPAPTAPGADIALRGVAGETAAQLRARFARDALDAGAQVVVIAVGVNDVTAAALNPRRADALIASAAKHVGAMVLATRSAGLLPVVATAVRPAPLPAIRRLIWTSRVYALTATFNTSLRALPGADILDLDAALGDADPLKPLDTALTVDALHFSETGYARLNAALRDALGTF